MADKILGIILPIFLGAILSLLGWIGISLNRISESLAVVTYRIQNQEDRILSLEQWRRDWSAPLQRRN